ncbi:MAG: hypothetical protein H7Z74_03295, partial [Anaerolineae bacterium]|nr:hypothetical protein [Gemmatimonadaceae bacterium]
MAPSIRPVHDVTQALLASPNATGADDPQSAIRNLLTHRVPPGIDEAGLPAEESALGRYDMSRDPQRRVLLPGKLAEISGLAISQDGRMFAHDDERAVIFELNASGEIVKSFELGDRTVRGDFEGLAMAGGRFYMITSDGIIYEADEGDNGERVAFER